MATANKWVYKYQDVEEVMKARGGWDGVKNLYGGKGAGLAEMSRIGCPVPPGITISTEACVYYFKNGNQFPPKLWEQVLEGLKSLEAETGKKLGDPINPLLLSCRSGARVSMPGMMDTVLNVGLNNTTAQAMINLTKNERFVWDSYRRFIQGFSCVVLGLPDELFEEKIKHLKETKKIKYDIEMTAEDLKKLTEDFKKITTDAGHVFPDDPYEQVRQAIIAVFKSWLSKRACTYRQVTKIPEDWGTACNLVTMVFGNMGDTSGTGVAFSRNPSTGENKLYGEFLANAQGEDVVAGIRNTLPIAEMPKVMPEAYKTLHDISEKLEKHFKDMQDMEFTIENGKLWMLQTRDAKRTSSAALKVATDMVAEGLITKEMAVKRITPSNIDDQLHPQFEEKEIAKAKKEGRFLTKGNNASPGAGIGRCYLDPDLAEERAKNHKEDVILVRNFTKPDDIHGVIVAKGLLTTEGGATSHAAVVARQFGIPCISGANSIQIDMKTRTFTITDGAAKGTTIKEGDYISINGTTGEVFLGKVPTVVRKFEEMRELNMILKWADEISEQNNGLQVYANADYGADAKRARSFGAKGIGLCRTEHMFFEQERLPIVQKMILAKTKEERQACLDKLLGFQIKDFEDLFREMDPYPVTIRLLDPPLHEFLPGEMELLEKVTKLRYKENKTPEEIKELQASESLLKDVANFHESNPMLGLRGVRVQIAIPEIPIMQVRAIFKAACNAIRKFNCTPNPHIMIPLTTDVKELDVLHPIVKSVYEEVTKEEGITNLHYEYGTMVETPRAALTAGELAKTAEFFSFGTNDLTQMTFGYSRDDAERQFLMTYIEKGILKVNPFHSIDPFGVGRLVKLACEEGRSTRPKMSIGVCGEHGGDPVSIDFLSTAGLDYVSCSPFRVPIARLAAAHAAIKRKK